MLRNLHFPPIIRPSISRRRTYPRSVRGFIRRIPAASFSVSSFSPIGSGGFHSPGLSRLVMAGVDIRTVQELLGHKTISMTVRYSHLAPQHQLSAVERLDGLSAEPTDTTTDTRPFQSQVPEVAVLQ